MCFHLFPTILEKVETLKETKGFSPFLTGAGSPVAGIGGNTQENKGVLIVSDGGGFAPGRAEGAEGAKHAGKLLCFRISWLPTHRRLRCRFGEMNGNTVNSHVFH